MRVTDYNDLSLVAEQIFGQDYAMDKLIEEMSEVIHALQKYRKSRNKTQKVVSELGDMLLAFELFTYSKGLRGRVMDAKVKKTETLAHRLNLIMNVRNSTKENDVGRTDV